MFPLYRRTGFCQAYVDCVTNYLPRQPASCRRAGAGNEFAVDLNNNPCCQALSGVRYQQEPALRPRFSLYRRLCWTHSGRAGLCLPAGCSLTGRPADHRDGELMTRQSLSSSPNLNTITLQAERPTDREQQPSRISVAWRGIAENADGENSHRPFCLENSPARWRKCMVLTDLEKTTRWALFGRWSLALLEPGVNHPDRNWLLQENHRDELTLPSAALWSTQTSGGN